jgi:hypothetical protein
MVVLEAPTLAENGILKAFIGCGVLPYAESYPITAGGEPDALSPIFALIRALSPRPERHNNLDELAIMREVIDDEVLGL